MDIFQIITDFNFWILLGIAFLAMHFFYLSLEYGAPCQAGTAYSTVFIAIIATVLFVIKEEILTFNWLSIILGIIAYIAAHLVKFIICRIIDKIEDMREKRRKNK